MLKRVTRRFCYRYFGPRLERLIRAHEAPFNLLDLVFDRCFGETDAGCIATW